MADHPHRPAGLGRVDRGRQLRPVLAGLRDRGDLNRAARRVRRRDLDADLDVGLPVRGGHGRRRGLRGAHRRALDPHRDRRAGGRPRPVAGQRDPDDLERPGRRAAEQFRRGHARNPHASSSHGHRRTCPRSGCAHGSAAPAAPTSPTRPRQVSRQPQPTLANLPRQAGPARARSELPTCRKTCSERSISKHVFRDAAGDGAGRERPHLAISDPKMMRALAHPLRVALIEAIGQADSQTLTATEASELLGESPANCAFHLRTLAKYGFVEEAGGGRGRQRPWRLRYSGLEISPPWEDQETRLAVQAAAGIWFDRWLTRARSRLMRDRRLPGRLAGGGDRLRVPPVPDRPGGPGAERGHRPPDRTVQGPVGRPVAAARPAACATRCWPSATR